MAYASLVSLAQTLDHLLIRHDSYVDHHQKQQIHSLHEKIVFLSTFLEDFPTEATKLEAPITVAANQVEDIFELHISNLIDSPQDFSFDDFTKLYEELQKPTTEINSIMEQVMEIKSSCTSENQIVISTHSSASFSSTPAPNVKGVVVGFEKDLREIQDQLHGESAKLEVIPIVGMGGIGKTTLARYALHDPLSLEHFDVSGWVTVSQNYDKATILLSLLNSIDASSKLEHSPDESLLLELVYKYLKGRRFLIVVDDIWNSETWDDLRRVFPDDFNGSRIIITTRGADVASYVNSSIHPYEMHLMGVDSSWNLLRQNVFEDEQCPPELEEIGNQIAEKCRGLPLAIVVIAGVLSKVDRMQETWKKIAINVKEAVNTSDEPFAEILSLSYTWLPHHLRPCFLYMGGFPKDYEIHVSKLVRMWVAEGFLKSNGSKGLEEVAEDYLEDLTKRNLVLIIKKRYNGRIKSIKMHDLLRDLCLKKAHDENFLHPHECQGSLLPIRKSRRISLLSNVKDLFLNMDYSPIHTILVFDDDSKLGSWKHCRLLRVVDFNNSGLLVDDKISELLHLRYLAITAFNLHISKVPEYFSKLVDLQTLNIRGSWYRRRLDLPLGIWRMRELRHVIVSDGFLPGPSAETCDHVLPLQNLHTLKRILDFRCSERILELISNLKKLGIFYDYETKWSEYSLNNLVHLQKLEKLNIYAPPCPFKCDLSDRLAFPVTLKKLTLCGIQIPWEDMSIVGLLSNLQVLKLKLNACRGFMWETVEGQFCHLKVLVIQNTDPNVWITESCHFPRLERLILRDCNKLSEIPRGIGDIPTLQLIELWICKSSIVKSAKSIVEEQHDFGNDLLQLHLKKSAKSILVKQRIQLHLKGARDWWKFK